MNVLVTQEILSKSLNLLDTEQNTRIVFNALEGNYALCLLANLINAAYLQRETALPSLYYPAFTVNILIFFSNTNTLLFINLLILLG